MKTSQKKSRINNYTIHYKTAHGSQFLTQYCKDYDGEVHTATIQAGREDTAIKRLNTQVASTGLGRKIRIIKVVKTK